MENRETFLFQNTNETVFSIKPAEIIKLIFTHAKENKILYRDYFQTSGGMKYLHQNDIHLPSWHLY